MKKYLLLGFTLTFLSGSIAFAQQKVKDGTVNNGNLANKDAILELESANKGFLHARVALKASTDASPLSAHVAGMMVYNTATSADVVPGIYYNDGTKWVLAKGATNTNTVIVEAQPGKTGAPGIPGQPGGPAAGVVIVNNDSGTWVFNPLTNTWTNIAGQKGADGKSITTGAGAPMGGNNGDTYINTTTGDVYTNTNGTWTVTGNIKGKDGIDGKSVTGAPGIPGAGTGNNGDTYINTTTGEVYTNTNGTWTVTGNLKGKDGKDGIDGKSVTGASGIPGAGTGNNGDTYINTTTGDVYTNTNGTWTVTGNIKGTDGIDGKDGKSVTGAPGIPGAGTGNNGDTYINTTTGDVYTNTNGTWTVTGNIKGTDGIDGKSVTITNNADGSSTITDGAGGTVTVKNGTNGTNGIDGKSVTITNNADGSSTITDGAGGTVTVKNGTNGTNGIDGKSVTITNNADGSSTITDGAGGTVTVKNGTNGTNGIDGKSVTITNNADGSSTITDGAGGTVTVKNGTNGTNGIDGKSVTITNNADGSSTITDGAGGTVTLKNGTNGTNGIDGKSVTITNNADGSSTITDGAGGTVTVKNGTNGANGIDGKSVTITNNADGSSTITDGAGGTVTVKNGIDGIGGKTIAGTGISITGAGTDASPYVINNTVIDTDNQTITDFSLDNTTKVLTLTLERGNTKTVDLTGLIPATISADNGLTKTLNNIQLGGALLKPTTVTTNITNTLALAGLQAGAGTENLVVADPLTGVLKSVPFASTVVEPWNAQTTTNKASLNTQNIYQQGKVGVGFSAADSVSTKQFEVKGDMKSLVMDADGNYHAIESNGSINGVQSTLIGVSNNSDLAAITATTKLNAISVNANQADLITLNAADGLLSNVQTNFNSVMLNHTSQTGLSSIEVKDKTIDLKAANNAGNASSLNVTNDAGIKFLFNNATGAGEGAYTFPRNNGTANQILITNGNASDAQLSWADVSTIAPEPWKIQTTTNNATLNSNDIYQQGKVGVGFTATDAVSTKQFEVKGDVKAKYLNGGNYYGIETGDVGIGIPTTLAYVSNNVDISSATELTLNMLRPGLAQMQSNNGSAGGNIAAFSSTTGGTAGFVANNSTGDVTASIWGYSDAATQSRVLLSHAKSSAEGTNVSIEKLKGVTYDFNKVDGTKEGNYTFPRNSGTANQVLTTDGITGNAQLSWKDAAGFAIRTESANYTALSADETILVKTGTATIKVTLPTASANKGKKYTVKMVEGTGAVNVISAGGAIDGNAAATGITGSLIWQGWVFQSDGADWYIISRI